MSKLPVPPDQRIVPRERPRHAERACYFGAAALLASLLLAGCHSTASSGTPEGSAEKPADARTGPVTVTVATVETRPVQRRISAVGSLHGFERVTVTPKVEGRVAAIHYDVGDRLGPEATLLEIDPTDFVLAVEETERSLEQELSRLGVAKSPADDFDIEQLPSVERARLLLENAQNRYQRQKKLVAQNAVSHEAFEQTENDVQVAAASLRQARFDARTALASVRQREAMLASARRKLEETRVTAPRLPKLPALQEPPSRPGEAGEVPAPQPTRPADSGKGPHEFVVARRMVSVGEMVRAFPATPAFELVIDDVLKLKIMVPERYLAQVNTGLATEVRVEAYPDRFFPARIGRVNPTIDPQSRTFEVEALVPNPRHLLKHGGFAKADIIVQETAEALTVPAEAVTRFAGVSKVFRIRDDAAEEVVIDVRERGAGWVEVAGDLHPGDVVATSGQSRLANGTKVVVRQKPARTAKRDPK
ncbi:MAG: efflux RND transporter periplasmic adaptor subunit [Deltaproteobacteria bacterium]